MSNKMTIPDRLLPTASAYAIVASREEEEPFAAGVTEQKLPTMAYATTVVHDDDDAGCVGVNVHNMMPAGRRISPEFSQLLASHAIASNEITWNDDFFDDYNEQHDHEDGDRIVAVFDFDYTGMECHYKTLSWSCFATTAICLPSFIPLLVLGLVPCYINPNVRWNVRAQHLAVTSRNGIVFCHDTRPTCWGSCVIAKRTKTIPFDQIGDVVVVSEAGSNATCVLGCNAPLSTVSVVGKPTITPASNSNDASAAVRNNKTELVILGLQNPNAFSKVAMAMKRANNTLHDRANAAVSQATACIGLQQQQQMVRGKIEGTTTTNEQLAVLLREIRDELRQSNQVHAATVIVQRATAPPHDHANVEII
jgi:uncharacterized membrane protein YfbV (UPF0208 family)